MPYRKLTSNDRLVRNEWQRDRKNRRRRHIQRYKLTKGCERCGYNKHPAALHFDHINPSEKKYHISSGSLLLCSLKTVMIELRKCRILCANCHMEHTHG